MSPAAKALMTASFSLGFILPWTQATRRWGNTCSWSILA